MESIFSTIINTLTDNIFSLNVFFLFSVKHIVRVEIIILLGITLKVILTVVCKYSLRCKQFKEQYIKRSQSLQNNHKYKPFCQQEKLRTANKIIDNSFGRISRNLFAVFNTICSSSVHFEIRFRCK